MFFLWSLLSALFSFLLPQKFSTKELTDLGFEIIKTEAIEFKPNPFNQDYLISKQKTGHILYEAREKIQKYELNFQKCEPFIPYHLEKCKRFIHIASYYLPIKPINNKIIKYVIPY